MGGNTLVVELLAKNLALFHGIRQHYSLGEMLSDLQNKGLLALTKSTEVTTGYQAKDELRRETPEAIIAAMYELSDLSREQVALLSVFAVLPAENVGFDWLEMLLPDAAALDQNALALAQRGWIEYDEDTTAFKCNPVVQEVTRKKNKDLRADCDTLINSLVEKLHHETIQEENYAYSMVFAHYGETVLAAFEAPDVQMFVLCQNIGNYYTATGNLASALYFYQKYRHISQQLLGAEPNNPDFKNRLAISYEKLGDTHSALGHLDKALGFFQERSKLGKELYEAYPKHVSYKNGLAISYAKLGVFNRDNLKDKTKARHYLQQAETLWLELVQDAPQVVEFQRFLGMVQRDLKDL